jgi:3',5'-cyclic AMP phosphodiesterase CpdA
LTGLTFAARSIWSALLFGALFIAAHGALTADDVKTFRFAVYGDTRDGHDAHRDVVAQIIKAAPDFVIQTGDLVHDGKNESEWKTYDEITADMRTRFPVYPSRGNHDVGGPGYEARVTAPISSGNKLWYSFNRGNSHFVALAIDEFTPFDATSDQYKWLIADLAAASKNARHIFVFFHVGPYSIGSHGSFLPVRTTLCPLFIKYGVRAVFNGHDHIYYHTLRDGIHYIVSGGGGAPLYYPDPKKGAIAGDKWERAHHYLICDVIGDKIEVTVNRSDGSTIEHFVIAR